MLPPETFDIPAAEIRHGYRTAIYFNRAKKIAAANPEIDSLGVLMQVFQKNKGTVLCGMDEAVALLKIGAGRWSNEKDADAVFVEYLYWKRRTRGDGRDGRLLAMKQLVRCEDILDELWISEYDELEVEGLVDGTIVEPWETVLTVKGRYSSFAHLESVYLGVLARRSLVASNTRRVVDAANGKQVLFFADRFDHWSTQSGDGYAAKIGGASGVASDAMAAWWGDKGVGTMPHALIAFFEGDTVMACEAFHEEYPDTNLIALVDFNNDCVHESLACAQKFGDDLYAVRLDTSENMVDASMTNWNRSYSGHRMGDFKPTGVNPVLVENVRKGLDTNGFEHVKIIVSGGFNPERITEFERLQVPTDGYAVGSSLLQGSNDFTADIVEPVAKQGRMKRAMP